MTREQAKQLMPIIVAFAEGAVVQYKDPNLDWTEINSPDFNQGSHRYRIKPEPRKFVVWMKRGSCYVYLPDENPYRELTEDGWTRIPVTEDIS